MSDDTTIEAGRTAWEKIHGATTFENWKKVALAVSIGRQHALHEADQNKPFGPKYSRALNQWLDANNFREMAEEIRIVCCTVADNIDAIDAWRATLSAEKRARQNNPFVVLRCWRASKPKTSQFRQHVSTTIEKRGRCNAPIRWPQAVIRRTATALSQCRSNDYFVMALAVLEAAIPTEQALLELLPDDPPPRRVAAPVALELQA